MTDSWTETIARLNAAGQEAEGDASSVSQHHPEQVAGPAAWQPYGIEGDLPAEPAAPVAAPADPLIQELEPALIQPAPAIVESPSSVYGRVETPAVTETSVAPPEKPIEAEPERADPAPVAAAAPEPAPIVAAEPPPPASLPLPEAVTPKPELVAVSHTSSRPNHDAIDPVLAGFDHVVALAGYVLLFISVFMFGVPALATMALAYAHKNDAHLLVRSHYRFQLRIFWTAVLFALLAIGSAITAGGMAITTLVDFARAHLPGVGEAMEQAHVGSWSGQISGLLLIAAVTLGVLALVWTLVASLFGFLRLVANRPIGHDYAAR